MIEKYIETILSNDYKALAKCFAPDCRYLDYCPQTIGKANYHLYGQKGVEMFFHNKMTFHTLSITDYVIEDERHANFFVSNRGYYIYARVTIEKFSPEGLIEILTVRPD